MSVRRPGRRARRLVIDSLENRLAPATFTGVSSTLTIDLNSANETATFSTDGTTVTVTLTNGMADTTGTGGNVTGNGTATATFSAANYNSLITITDSAAGTSVAFADSAGDYLPQFNITLNDPASGNITFAGDSTFTQTVTVVTSAGFVASDVGSSMTVSPGPASLVVNAIGHDILFRGTLTVAGQTTLAGAVIQADNPANDFVGSLQLSGPIVASIVDVNALDLAASNFGFSAPNQTTHITAGGNITQSGALAVSGTGILDFASTSGSITLTDPANNINLNAAVALSVTGANTATIVNTTTVALGDVRMGTGLLSVTANGNIVQLNGTTIDTGGPITCTIGTNNRDVSLSNAGNRIAGTITVAETTPGFIRDVNIRNADDGAMPPVGTPMTTPADIRNLSLYFDNNGITLPGYNISNNLSVTAGGDINQSAALTIGGATTITILGDFGIDLGTTTNSFAGTVGLNAPQSTRPVLVVDGANLALGPSDLGRGNLDATAVTGNITSNASITQRKQAGAATFTVTTGNTVSLTGANDFAGGANFAGAALNTVNVRNTDFQATFSDFVIPATVTSLTVTLDNAAAVLPPLTLTNLTVTALGIVQQPNAALTVFGTGTFSAGAYAIDLSNAGNEFNNINLSNSGRNAVTVVDALDLAFSGNSTVGTGRLSITAAGNITAAGAGRITQANTGPVGDVTLTSTLGSITLNNNNAFRGPFSASVTGANSVSVHNNNVPLVLGDITTPGGAFSADAGNQSITQDPNSALNLGSTSSFAAGNAVTLTNRTNTLTGAVSLNTNNASIRATGAVVLGTSTVGGTLSVKTGGSAGHSITQTGAVTGGSDATFDAGAGDVILTNANNDLDSVSIFSTGNTASVSDTNNLSVGTVRLGGGTLNLSAGTGGVGSILTLAGSDGIVQSTGSGAITLTTPSAGTITLDSADNALRGDVNVVHATNVTVRTRGDLSFTVGSAISGNFTPTAGGTLTLPGTVNLAGQLFVSAASTPVDIDITAAGGLISFTGAVTFAGSRTLNAGTGVIFDGDVTAGGALTLNAAAGSVRLSSGTWTQGANPLTITGAGAGLIIGDTASPPARLVVSGGTISLPGNGTVLVRADGTLQVGTANAPETATIDNGTGSLLIDGNLAVGFGAVNDQLIKTGDGLIQIGATARLIGSGLAGTTATPVLATQTELITGRFVNSVDADDNPRDFFAGSDIVSPAYSFTDVRVKAGGVAAPIGTAVGTLPDGDKYSVKTSLGSAGKLVTVEDVSGHLDVVVRNTTAAGASTLTFTALGGGDGQLPVGGLAVHTPGAVTVTAPAANFVGRFTTTGTLAALTARDIGDADPLGFSLTDGGPTSAGTSITARVVQNASVDLAGTLKTLRAVSVDGGSLTARSFGSLTTTGLKAAGDPGDFNPTLISTTPTAGTIVASATIAGTLGGEWDLRGRVGTVRAFRTDSWTLGVPAGANVHNGDLLTGAASLTLGPVGNSSFHSSGNIALVTTSNVVNSDLTAGSFGTVNVVPSPALGLVGNFSNSRLTATGNVAGVALATMAVAGNLDGASELNFLDGNATAIRVGRTVTGSTITATDTGTLGNIASITAGRWQNSNVDARSVGSLRVTGNLAAGLFGDFTGSTVTVRANKAGVGLGTFSAQGNVSSSTFDVQNGNLTNFLVGRQLGLSTIKLTDPTFGSLGVIQAGDWTTGNSVLARTIGAVTSIGAAEVLPASPLLLGGINGDTITAYLEAGTTPAIGRLTTRGDLGSSAVSAERGIGTVTIGRTAVNSFVIADDALAGSATVGRINALTAGAWSGSTAAANTLGTVRIIGYTQPESSTANPVPGDVTNGTFQANGAAGTTPIGIGSLSVAHFVQANSAVRAPFGIKSLTVTGGVLGNSQVVTDNPLTPAAGVLGTFTAGEVSSTTVRTGSIGAMRVTGYRPSNFLGSVTGSTVSADSTAATTTGPQAVRSLTVAGDFTDSVLDAPATVGLVTVGGRVDSVAAPTRVQAGYASGSKVGSLTAGAWGIPGSGRTTDLSTNSITTFALKGNSARGFVGTADRAFIDILENVAGVGLGTFTATGTVADSLFRVSDGNVGSFTVQRFRSSDLLVGFRPVKGSDISAGSADWSTTNHKIGSFKTTAPFSSADVADSASFVDSNVVAANLGTVNITGVNPETTNSTSFGLGFRSTTGSAGAVTIAGVLRTPVFTDGQFNFLGL